MYCHLHSDKDINWYLLSSFVISYICFWLFCPSELWCFVNVNACICSDSFCRVLFLNINNNNKNNNNNSNNNNNHNNDNNNNHNINNNNNNNIYRLKSQPYYNVYTPLDPEECLTVLKHFSDKRLNIQSNSARVRFLPRKSVFPSVGFEPTSLAHCSTNSLSYIYIRWNFNPDCNILFCCVI